MANGFIGNAAYAYLVAVENALKESAKVHTDNAHGVAIRNELPPVLPEEARGGSFFTGADDLSNIVTDSNDYESSMREVSDASDDVNSIYYTTAREMEDMCGTSFVLPKTAQRCSHMCSDAKSFMSFKNMEMYELTMLTYKYVKE